MPKVHFIKEDKIIEMKPGAPIWYAANEGIKFVKYPSCQGQGRCKKCACKINGEIIEDSCNYRVGEVDLEVETLVNYEL